MNNESKNPSPIVETSIIMPVYNAESFLRETLDSILDQDYKHWELVAVNDSSSDDSLSILNDYKKRDGRIKVISMEKSTGPAKARNAAIEAASGRFIAFLDSDDVWYKDKLSSQIGFMHETGSALTFGGYEFMTEDGEVLGSVTVPVSVDYNRLLKGNVIACLTAVYDTNQTGKVFMPDILKRQDFGLWLKILKRGFLANGIQTSLGKYRVRKNSVSSSKLKTLKYTWSLYRDVEKISFIKTAFYLGNHLFFATLKRLKSKLVK